MTMNNGKIALVTGANSGIGFEASAQLTEAGFRGVILACRTLERAETAKSRLIERSSRDVFDVLAVDVAELKSVAAACDNLVERNKKIDFLLLNAGMSPGPQPAYNTNGVELTFASSLIGHHLMTMRLLADKILAERARIMIAGSEAARGGLPGLKMPDFAALAADHFDGDLEAAMEAVARVQPPYKFHWASSYGTAKLFVAWWAAALSRRLPPGQTVNAVSPGGASATNFARHQPLLMRLMMRGTARLIGRFIGMDGPVSAAARRYLEAEAFDDDTTGRFFASPAGKVVGDLQVQQDPNFLDRAGQEACWNVVIRLAGGASSPYEED